MSDDNIDKLFQEAAEQHQPTFNPENWDKMSSLLDNPVAPNGGTGSAGSIIGWKGVASVITLATLSLILYYSQNSRSEQNQIDANKGYVKEEQPDKAISENPTGDEIELLPNSVNPEVSELISSEASSSHSKAPVQSGASSIQSKSIVPSAKSLVNDPAIVLDNGGSLNEQEGVKIEKELEPTSTDYVALAEKSVISGDLQNADKQDSNLISQDNSSPSQPGKEQLSTGNIQPVISKNSLTATKSKLPCEQEPVIENVESKQAEEPDSVFSKEKVSDELSSPDQEEVSLFPRGLSLKLGVSPDFSSVKFKSSSGMGFNIALLADYRFAKHWSVSTGFITSKKVYSGKDVEYETSNSKVFVADNMEGGCNVIDIPLNVTYSFGNFARTSFFVSTGFSSYMMMSEHYTWAYKNGANYYSNASHETNDWFKQLNFSVGIQKKLNDHFYLQAEPFVKAPLAGVGVGKVSLTSLGAFINLRYSFNK